MEGIFGFVIIIYLVIYLFARKKAAQKEAEQKEKAAQTASARYSAAQQNRRYADSPRPAASTQRTSAASYQQSSAYQRAASFDSAHYHQEGYDFATCFSFKDVPRGTDELSALIRANTRHEHELEKLLHVRE